MKPYYQEDGITIYHGDCLEILPDIRHHAEVMVTDPPYGMAYKSGWTGHSVNGDESTDARDKMLALWDGPALVFGEWKCPRPANAHHMLIWNKGDWPGMGELALPWGPSYEAIYVIGKGWVGKRAGSILHYPYRPNGKDGWHPTEKPESLMDCLIRATRSLFTVIDPFMGTGAVPAAAKRLQRRAIGIEIEERYCEIAAKRLSQGVLDLCQSSTV